MKHGTTRVVPPELCRLREAIDALAGIDPSLLCDAASIEEFERQRARFDCLTTKAVAAFDQWGAWAGSGAKNPTAWLDTHCHIPKREAHGQLRRGRALPHMPLAAQAWERGEIGTAQIDALEKVRGSGTEELFARDEELLVTKAKELKFTEFCRVVDYWEQHADPDGAAATDMARRARRDVYLAASFDGMYLGQMTLDPISGEIVAGELSRLERELFEADWAKAQEELGRPPKLHELARTSAQRRADALVEMATRSRTVPADGRRPEPLFSVFVGFETLQGRISQLAYGQVVSPDSLLTWLDAAEFERAVFAPGRRVEVSVRSRFFTGATRRGIELRDRECTDPNCDIPADACQIDHVLPFTEGGLTTQENGEVACGYHNRLRYQRPPPDG